MIGTLGKCMLERTLTLSHQLYEVEWSIPFLLPASAAKRSPVIARRTVSEYLTTTRGFSSHQYNAA